jgi:hypothetical protein
VQPPGSGGGEPKVQAPVGLRIFRAD